MTDTREYGRALFMLTEELGTTDSVLSDVEALRTAIRQNPEYLRLLDSPTLKKEERTALIGEALGILDKNLINLIKILCERRLAHATLGALNAFVAEHDASRGIERVEAISAVALSEEQMARIAEKLKSQTGKEIVIKNTIDADILGGIRLRYCGRQLDGSLKTRLDTLEEKLKKILI